MTLKIEWLTEGYAGNGMFPGEFRKSYLEWLDQGCPPEWLPFYEEAIEAGFTKQWTVSESVDQRAFPLVISRVFKKEP